MSYLATAYINTVASNLDDLKEFKNDTNELNACKSLETFSRIQFFNNISKFFQVG